MEEVCPEANKTVYNPVRPCSIMVTGSSVHFVGKCQFESDQGLHCYCFRLNKQTIKIV